MSEEQKRDWAGIPWPVLSAIMEKITGIDDYVRFGAVCAPWRTAAFLEENSVTVKKKQQLSSFPFLLIPRPDPQLLLEPQPQPRNVTLKRKSFSLARCIQAKRRMVESEKGAPTEEEAAGRCLYRISGEKVYDFQVRMNHMEYCRGSSFGWLVTMEKREYVTGEHKTAVKYYVRLRNPFLPKKNDIDLPSLPLDGVVEGELSRPFIYLSKAVLSAAPDNNNNKNFAVMAIMSQFNRLAYFNPATEIFFGWTPIGDWNSCTHFDDVIYFNKAQQFYAVKRHTGEVLAIDIKQQTRGEYGQGPVISEFRQVGPPIITRPSGGICLTRFIVELPSGDLLQVLKHKPSEGNMKFEVYKLDPSGKGWNRIRSLGNTILFLGQNSSISRTATQDCPEWKPNCIYFTENTHFLFTSRCKLYDPEDMGMYNLQDGTIRPYFSTVSFGPQAMSPIWLQPPLLK